MHHNFTLPYFPWSNGAVEHLGRELLRIARELILEFQQPPTNGLTHYRFKNWSSTTHFPYIAQEMFLLPPLRA